jgi:hypothetical protein
MRPHEGRGEGDGWLDELAIYLISIKSCVGCGACGCVSESEHSLPSELARETGKRSRSAKPVVQISTVLLVNLARRAIAEAPSPTLLLVEAEPVAEGGLGVGHRLIATPCRCRVPAKSSPVKRLPRSV